MKAQQEYTLSQRVRVGGDVCDVERGQRSIDTSRQCLPLLWLCCCRAWSTSAGGSPGRKMVPQLADQKDCATGMGTRRERAPVGYGPGTQVLLSPVAAWSKRGKKAEAAEPLLGDWNGKGAWS